jgi:CsoR family transcriptional regulator, copper-sensing transcriptional repressor
MEDTTKRDALRRLAYIEGHLRGVRRMVEADTYCADVLHQTHAIQKALEGFEQLLLQGHLRICVPSGIREGREAAVLAELADLYGVARRWRTADAASGDTATPEGAGGEMAHVTDDAAEASAAGVASGATAAAAPESAPTPHPIGDSHGRRAPR